MSFAKQAGAWASLVLFLVWIGLLALFCGASFTVLLYIYTIIALVIAIFAIVYLFWWATEGWW